MILMDINNDRGNFNILTNVNYILAYLRERPESVSVEIYDVYTGRSLEVTGFIEKLPRGIAKLYIDYAFMDGKTYEIQVFDVNVLLYRGQIVTGKDLINVDSSNYQTTGGKIKF